MVDKTALYFGALLHDVGKVVYRGSSEPGTHSKLGADFLAQDVGSANDEFDTNLGREIIDQVRYHHAKEIRSASCLCDDSLAFITYFADNISAGMDRKNEGDDERACSFDRGAKLRKVFNIINGHNDANTVNHDDYNCIRERIKKRLSETRLCKEEVNSLLDLLEATTSTVPSSTNTAELMDISLYDHAKTTAGIAACIYDYLTERSVTNYRETLFDQKNSIQYYEERMFALCSCDMSGIQDFIYNVSDSGALKQLRARSFYLEMLLEHIVDELLDRLGLCRANLLYAGGGHAYFILPNTASAKENTYRFFEEACSWLVEHYRTDLYIASAWVECSAHDLMNEGEDKHRYASLYRRLSRQLSEKKASRYSEEVLRKLNFEAEGEFDRERECKECYRSDLQIDESEKCPLCLALDRISNDLVKKAVFVVVDDAIVSKSAAVHDALMLPFGCRLLAYSEDDYLAQKPSARRVYTKNQWDMGEKLATHIWMGDYTKYNDDANRFEKYSTEGKTLSDCGIKRLGVLRADVDNLGTVFVSGIPADKASISRTATLSRSLSYFFKKRINEVLEKDDYCAQVIYSGGDDLFIIGNWSDVIHASVAIRNAFDNFTGNGSLTISAGIGMFTPKYPVARMALEVGELEDAAKMHVACDGKETTKNAVALWTNGAVFGWDEFVGKVLPRYEELCQVFKKLDATENPSADRKGKAFIYKLVELLRDFDDAISAPRLAYLLARTFGSQDSNYCEKFYRWAADDGERRYLITALEWYVYSTRERVTV